MPAKLRAAARTARAKFVREGRAAGRDWNSLAAELGMARDALMNWWSVHTRTSALKHTKTTTQRACLSCQRPFASEGAHNRMCQNCRKHVGSLSPLTPDPGGDTGRRVQSRGGAR